MKQFLPLCVLVLLVVCLLVPPANGIFGGDKKKEDGKGQCSVYKGRCGASLTKSCCKAPYKCALQTKLCGKDKLCCVTEADIQRHKQETGSWLKDRSGK